MKQPALVIPWNRENSIFDLMEREWLVTNGLGGYASGTLLGVSMRRYHGLFCPNLPAPRGRTMMIPRLDECLEVSGNSILLTGAQLPDGRIESEGHIFLNEFRLEAQIPVWLYQINGHQLERRILMPYGQNTVLIQYKLLQGEPIKLKLYPYLTCRMHDGPLGSPREWPFKMTIVHNHYEVQAFEGAPILRMAVKGLAGSFLCQEKHGVQVFYRIEQERGHDFIESLFSPGCFSIDLMAGQEFSFMASTHAWDVLETEPAIILEAEHQRREKILMRSKETETKSDSFLTQLFLAADQFIILPWTRAEESLVLQASGERLRSIIAGYHWFTDWGRDTMISLEGLTLCTGRWEEAQAILKTFSHYIRNGLIPNHFREGESTAIYNTVDASFWFFHALDRYFAITGDIETLKTLFPSAKTIIEWHIKGTEFGIHMDPSDGLIQAEAEGYQLTWMDAKVDNWVVTPRRGKAVEIQALWYNALKLFESWGQILNEPVDPFIKTLPEHVSQSFNQKFWNENEGYLYDVINGENFKDTSFRPNQIFAISLRFPILDQQYWQRVVDQVSEKLLTPFGLRTLDQKNKEYHGRYEGNRWERDAAYHQGLVWAWLVGPFMDAWLKVYPDRSRARSLLAGFEHHLKDAGIGTISELFDGDRPYTPRGCIAQAWSVGEVLRCFLLLRDSK